MDPISLVVTALAMGATSGLKEAAPTAINDAYAGLKRFIRDKYAAANDSVEHLEKSPELQRRQNGLTEELGKAGAAADAALAAQARALIELVETHDPETARTFGVNLRRFEGGELQLGRVVVHAEQGPVTGVDLEGGKVSGRTVVGDVEVTSGSTDPKDRPQ